MSAHREWRGVVMEALRDAARLLAVRLDNIGDVVMLSPALRALKRAAPKARLTLMVSPAGAAAAELLVEVDEIVVHRALWQDARGDMKHDPGREQLLIEELRAPRFDAVFVFTSFSQTPFPAAYACYLAGIPIRVAQSREFGGGVLTHWVRPLPDATHQVDRNLHLLTEVGVGLPVAGARTLRLNVTHEAQAQADALLREAGIRGGFVAVAPGATCSARRYPEERYKEVAARLRQAGHDVVIVGGPKDVQVGQGLAEGLPGVLSLCGRTRLSELAGVLRRARLLIANDSGPMHVGDAMGCPMVILYSGTELEEQWRPRNAPVRLLRRPTACSPCYRFECPYDRECLAIAPGDVVAEVLTLLAETTREVADG